MRIALAQINPVVGAIGPNTSLIGDCIDRALAQQADLLVFPELAIVGYPPKDLLLKPAVIRDCAAAVEQLADRCRGITAVIGYPRATTRGVGLPLHNAAAICRDGRVVEHRFKHLLPTYDVFDEHRYFEPGKRVDLTDLHLNATPAEGASGGPSGGQTGGQAGGQTGGHSERPDAIPVGVSICEDLWAAGEHFERRIYHDNPIDELAAAGARLFINCSASPFVIGKHAQRLAIMRRLAAEHRIPIVFVNQVGGNDELVFDGNSCVVAPASPDTGQADVIAHAAAFEEDLLIADLNLDATPPRSTTPPSTPPRSTTPRSIASHREPANPHPTAALPPADLADAYAALRLGLRDCVRKCGFRSVVVGLSGGIDSALTAAIAADALGPDNVRGVSMPSRYSSDHSRSDAADLAQRLGIAFHSVPIAEPHAAMERLLAPVFAELGKPDADVTEENIQARLRGVTMMAFSNKLASLLLTTGNKSELAVGYCTLYGDMCGGLAVISDVPKTMVFQLCRWLNTPDSPLHRRLGHPPIPENTIVKPPSAELRPDQLDADSLPPYDTLDEIVERYVERHQSAQRIVRETGIDDATVQRMVRLIDLNEYKRKQAAPGLKITGRAFGFGRRMPIAQRYRPGEAARPAVAASGD